MRTSNDRKEIYTANKLNQYAARTVPSYIDVMGTATNVATVTVRDSLHNDLPAPVIRQGDYFYKAYPVDNLTQVFHADLEINAVINPAGTNDPDIVKTEVRSAFVPQTPEAFVYDEDGNMTSDGRFTYIYNGENRLVVVSNASTLVEYAYDYQGRMFERTVNGVHHDYLWEGWNIISETSSNVTNIFTWGLDISGSMQGAGGVGGLASASLSGTNVFYCYDANGNVTDLMDLDGSVVAQYDYDPFGNLLIDEETIPGNPFKFSTKFWEHETELLHYELRPNKPSLGRWIQRDPAQEVGGNNLYAFVGNRVVDSIDILGEKILSLDVRGAGESLAAKHGAKWYQAFSSPGMNKIVRGNKLGYHGGRYKKSVGRWKLKTRMVSFGGFKWETVVKWMMTGGTRGYPTVEHTIDSYKFWLVSKGKRTALDAGSGVADGPAQHSVYSLYDPKTGKKYENGTEVMMWGIDIPMAQDDCPAENRSIEFSGTWSVMAKEPLNRGYMSYGKAKIKISFKYETLNPEQGEGAFEVIEQPIISGGKMR